MVRETGPDEIGVSVSYPLPGTRFYERVASSLGAKRNWTDSDDLAMMFRGSYSGDLYHALHDALHLEVDLRKRNGQAAGRQRLRELWSQIEELEKSSANTHPWSLS